MGTASGIDIRSLPQKHTFCMAWEDGWQAILISWQVISIRNTVRGLLGHNTSSNKLALK